MNHTAAVNINYILTGVFVYDVNSSRALGDLNTAILGKEISIEKLYILWFCIIHDRNSNASPGSAVIESQRVG